MTPRANTRSNSSVPTSPTNWHAWATPLISAGFGAGIVIALIVLAPQLLDPVRAGRHPGILLPAIAGGAILAMVVHELGHLIGGRLAGWIPVYFTVGPLRVARLDGAWQWARHGEVALYGGMALAVPPRWDGFDRFVRGNVLMLAAGPLMSLLFAATAAYLVDGLVTGVPARTTLAMTAIFSLAIGLGTLLPMSAVGALRTDGGQLLDLVRAQRDGAAGESRIALRALRIMGTHHHPASWDSSLVASALDEQPDHGERIAAQLYAAWAAMGQGDVASAGARLERAWQLAALLPDGLPGTTIARAEVAVERALYEGAWSAHPETVRPWLARAGNAFSSTTPALLARAATALDDNNHAVAADLLAEVERLRMTAAFPIALTVYAPSVDRLRSRLIAFGASRSP